MQQLAANRIRGFPVQPWLYMVDQVKVGDRKVNAPCVATLSVIAGRSLSVCHSIPVAKWHNKKLSTLLSDSLQTRMWQSTLDARWLVTTCLLSSLLRSASSGVVLKNWTKSKVKLNSFSYSEMCCFVNSDFLHVNIFSPALLGGLPKTDKQPDYLWVWQ